eukprot:scaffold8920_cov131-Isochrysis_galbana.AAC.2
MMTDTPHPAAVGKLQALPSQQAGAPRVRRRMPMRWGKRSARARRSPCPPPLPPPPTHPMLPP